MIETEVPQVLNVVPIAEAAPEVAAPHVWIDFRPQGDSELRLLTGLRDEPAALVWEQLEGQQRRLVCFLRGEQIDALYQAFGAQP